MTSEVQDRDPVEILGEEFLARRRRGEEPRIEQYIDEHRQYADQINALFPAMIAMEDLKMTHSLSSDRPIRLHVDRLERLGDFRIIREIGHGGMGIVYEAEQQSLHRRVAVKVFPKQAIGDSQQLKRFQREAETAGALHHTNIVPVFGVGEQDGLHYFVMQYIDGVSLESMTHGLADLEPDFRCDDYVRHVFDQQLEWKRSSQDQSTDQTQDATPDNVSAVDLRQSDIVGAPSVPTHRGFGREHWRRIADLGIQVAEALQYAHSRGVMHRDIKPSNLILGLDFRVWVTDFGLAVSPEQERLSRSGDVVGTLRYMSPEQLNGHSDQRSDIYALGLTLYELLTTRPAFEGQSRGSLIRKVSKSSPPAPRSLCPEIPKDLETVILKAIARSPESRYRTAEALAEDLRRFCDDQPIRARRIGAVERLCRWGRRNPALAGMSMAMILGAVFSFAAVSWNWRQAVREKKNAETEGARAENNLTLALGSMDRLLERFESDWMSHPVASDGASESHVRFVVSNHSAAILEEALVFYDQFAHQNAGSPKLQRATATAYRRAGDILDRLGRYGDAELAYRRAADSLILQMKVGDVKKNDGAKGDDGRASEAELVAETAAVFNRLSLVLHEMYRSEEAKDVLENAKTLLTEQLHLHESSACTYQLARTNSNLGLALWRLHQGEESNKRHRRAVFLLEGLAEENPFEAKYRLALARAYRNYYPIAAVCKDPVSANEIQASAESILDKLVADFPSVPDYRCELSEMLTLTSQQGRFAESQRRQQIERAVQLADYLNREFRSIPRYQAALAKSLSAQAILLRHSQPDQAIRIHERCTELLRQLCDQFPEVSAYRSFIALSMREHGVTLRNLDRLEESICVMEEAVAEQNAYLEARPSSLFGRKAMAQHLRELAVTMAQSGATDRSRELRGQSESYWKRRPPVDESL